MTTITTTLLLALVGCAFAQQVTDVNSITTPSGCSNLVMNGNFERDGHGGNPGYWYYVPSDWSVAQAGSTTRSVVVTNGNRPWGGLSSGAGTYFAAIQNAGACCTSIAQTINNLVVGQLYTLRFLAAERPGYGSAERVTVTMGGVTLLGSVNPLASFVLHQVSFTARATSAVLNFTNDAPSGDSTAFLDDISICAEHEECVEVPNGDFEHNPHGTNYQYIEPSNWTRDVPNSVVAMNGNSPWGGLNSGNGAYYVVLQGLGAQISQVIGGLTAGVSYQISFLGAERPGYGAEERLTVIVNGVIPTGADQINVYGSFVQHSFTFMQTQGTTANITFRNTAVAGGDQSVFVDEVRVCALPPPPPPVTTHTTHTTTVTATTVTPQLARDLSGLRTDIERVITAIDSRVAANEAMLSSYPALQMQVSTVAAAQQQVIGQVGAIANALGAAVSALPPASPPVSGPPQMPSVSVTSEGNLLLSAVGRNVQIDSSCGLLNPCDLLAALNALRTIA